MGKTIAARLVSLSPLATGEIVRHAFWHVFTHVACAFVTSLYLLLLVAATRSLTLITRIEFKPLSKVRKRSLSTSNSHRITLAKHIAIP